MSAPQLPRDIEQAGLAITTPAGVERGVDPFAVEEGRFQIQTIDGRVLGIHRAGDGAPVTTETSLLDTSDNVLWIVRKDDSDPEAFTLQNVAHNLFLAVRDTTVGSGVIGSTRPQALVKPRLESHPSAVRIIPRGQDLALQAAEQRDANQQVTLRSQDFVNPSWFNQFFVFNVLH